MDANRVLMAEIGAPHGVKGAVRVKAHCAKPMDLGAYGPLTADPGGGRLTVASLRPAKGVLIVQFQEIDHRDAAEALKGARLYIDRSRLPPPDEDEFYHTDLIGLEAVDEAGRHYGRVTAIHDFGAGPLLEIRPDAGASQLLPFTRETVPVMAIDAGHLVIDPPEGLFDVGADP